MLPLRSQGRLFFCPGPTPLPSKDPLLRAEMSTRDPCDDLDLVVLTDRQRRRFSPLFGSTLLSSRSSKFSFLSFFFLMKGFAAAPCASIPSGVLKPLRDVNRMGLLSAKGNNKFILRNSVAYK